MTPTTVRDIFHKVYKGSPNFMTPDVLRYGSKGDHVYELSRGDGFGDIKVMIGVTVLKREGSEWQKTKHSKVFYSHDDAEAFIASWTMRKGVTTIPTQETTP